MIYTILRISFTTEFIMDGGHGEGFCIGNILKYAQRYGKKDGYNRADLFKVIHYGFLALYNHDTHIKEVGKVMKISTDTRNVLKNFSTINSGIRVKSGNKLETISNMKNILAVEQR